ncbi:MAG TPA: hypothetical protein VGZ73_05820 [Bryobacteraceae bacterium]|nr:hypothetical protein [Bryobacteraceae bacterium]
MLAAAAAIVVAPLHVVAQAPSHSAKPTTAANQAKMAKAWTAPLTADGQPDLQGIWTNATLTPFERPRELSGKEFFTEEEAAAFTRKVLEQSNRDRRGASPQEDVGGAYNEAWFDRGTKVASSLRTSIVVDPTDGRVPAPTPAAREAAAERAAIQRRPPEGPEDFPLPVRCILWPTAGPPMVPGPYNNNYQILQTRDYVAIDVEMIHDLRIIPVDGRPHLPSTVSRWMGDSIGHWEGDTLVVDTTNFTDKSHFRGSDQNLHVVERFTRIGVDTIRYRFTIDDPTAFTKSWTGEIVMSRTAGPVYEYACHEGNYSLPFMLAGARAQEKGEAGESPRKRSK